MRPKALRRVMPRPAAAFLCLLALICLLAPLSPAAPARAETLTLEAPLYEGRFTEAARAFATGQSARTIRIRAELDFPKTAPADGRHSTVIVAHTSAGPGADTQLLKKVLLENGYAVLGYDSYTMRGFTDNNRQGNGGPKLELNQVADAFIALETLSRHPRIDPRRVGLVGVSAGGNTALLAAADWIKARYTQPATPAFAALVAIYPGGFILPAAEHMTLGSPILILPAEKDDFMKWPRTKVWFDYVKREAPAQPLDFILVPNAHHSFLNSNARGQYNPDAPSPNCPYLLAYPEGGARHLSLEGVVTPGPFPPTCFARGSTTGYSVDAANFALQKMLAFLKASFAAR